MSWVNKKEQNKEFKCRQCATFLDASELIKGHCPNGCSDDDLFTNELNEEE